MKEEFEAEKESILKTLKGLTDAMSREEKTIIELAAISTFIHNTYNGIENFLKRALKYLEVPLKTSQTWYKDLLVISVKNEIISSELSEKLDEFRAFRHFHVHGYGINLDDKKLIRLAKKLTNVWEVFESEINLFFKLIKKSKD